MRLFVYLIIGTVPILFAAVQPWVWSFYSLLMIAAFILYIWNKKEHIVYFKLKKEATYWPPFFLLIHFCFVCPYQLTSFPFSVLSDLNLSQRPRN